MKYNKEKDILEVSYEYYENGNIKLKKYIVNGKLHREDGPAIIEYYKNGNIAIEKYYNNNCLHRENGFAWIEYNKNGNINDNEYFLYGIRVNLNQYTDISYENIVNLINTCKRPLALSRIKLLIDIKVKENKEELLDLINAKLVMLKLI